MIKRLIESVTHFLFPWRQRDSYWREEIAHQRALRKESEDKLADPTWMADCGPAERLWHAQAPWCDPGSLNDAIEADKAWFASKRWHDAFSTYNDGTPTT